MVVDTVNWIDNAFYKVMKVADLAVGQIMPTSQRRIGQKSPTYSCSKFL